VILRPVLALLSLLLPVAAAQAQPAPADSLHGRVLFIDSLLTAETFRAVCEEARIDQLSYTFADPFSQPPLSLPQGSGISGASSVQSLLADCDLGKLRQSIAAQILTMSSFRGTDASPGSADLQARMRARVLSIADTSGPIMRRHYIRSLAAQDARQAWARTITDDVAADYAEIQSMQVTATASALRRFQTLPGVADAYGATADAHDEHGRHLLYWRRQMEAWYRLPEGERGPVPRLSEEMEWTVPPRAPESPPDGQ
jgi:hypothetical protein